MLQETDTQFPVHSQNLRKQPLFSLRNKVSPMDSLESYRVSQPQGRTNIQRVKEIRESERLLVIGSIGIQNLSHIER